MLKQSFIFNSILVIASSAMLLSLDSCTNTHSSNTGWNYNDSKWGGFEVHAYAGQETGPGLQLVEGGAFVMGNVEQNVTYDYDNIPKKVTIHSFYMDETEVANVHYREYLYWLGRTFGSDFPEVVNKALPDTLVWRDELAYNEPYVEYYFRHPAFNDYPVVGVSWVQANDYCAWRTDRVNEWIMVREGILETNPSQIDEDNFNTRAYLVGQYEGAIKKNLTDLNPNGTGERKVKMEDGILLPEYRLPTEAEWEYAALAIIGNNPYKDEELYTDRRIYPWNRDQLRDPKHGGWQGDFLANFKRGNGDMMGIAGGLNDNADITAPVFSFLPNDYGLYNMAGNVSEWVSDVYRPFTFYDASDFNPYRGNVFTKDSLDEEGYHVDKDSLGRLIKIPVSESENANRLNYRRSDVINFLDGDSLSEVEYNYSVTSLINDKARVYKGGSWADRAYYLAPGARRFLDENVSTSTIGFRCAMIRLGSPGGNEFPAGKQFDVKQQKKK